MAARPQDLSRAAWRKSSHSGQDGNCVEIATNLPAIIAMRDSKNPNGPALCFSRSNWSVFIQAIQAMQAGRPEAR